VSNLLVFIEVITEILHLLHVNIVESEPFHIEEAPEAAEGIVAGCGTACGTSHTAIALKGATLAHGENQDHRCRRPICIIKLLLIFSLSRPHIVLNGFHNVVPNVAGDDKKTSLWIL